MAKRDRQMREKARELSLNLADLLRLAGVGSTINQPQSGKVIRRSPELVLFEGGKLGDEGSEDEEP